LDRVPAACGRLTRAQLAFVPAADVPQGGVLLALPALLTEGLLRHTRPHYQLPPGYYPLESLFLYLALLALVRFFFFAVTGIGIDELLFWFRIAKNKRSRE
jgi:hypothetical protein